VRKIAADRDTVVIDQRREEATAAAALAAPTDMDATMAAFDAMTVEAPDEQD
jgi:DNA-directed RNA polymerase subunit beta'